MKNLAKKLDYLNEMAKYFEANKPQKSILVGDLNIAPKEEDVWDHKKLLKIVSHTPQEIEALNIVKSSANWVDITRKDIPYGLLYSWWSYRARDWDTADKGRRLDHIWATSDIAEYGYESRILRDVRGWEKPSDHAPVFASFDL
jgi:exodeoxyribonuclease-3